MNALAYQQRLQIKMKRFCKKLAHLLLTLLRDHLRSYSMGCLGTCKYLYNHFSCDDRLPIVAWVGGSQQGISDALANTCINLGVDATKAPRELTQALFTIAFRER